MNLGYPPLRAAISGLQEDKLKSKNIIILSAAIGLVIIFILNGIFITKNISGENKQTLNPVEAYNPQINPDDFTTNIDNKYFNFKSGKTYVFEGITDEGSERIEVYLTENIKKIMGVRVAEVRDRVYVDGDLAEDTRDWYAQDKNGNVWYFGESSKDFINGKLVSTDGSWVAGVYGAKPGIVMKADPLPGDEYYQEYYPGVAEDKGMVIAVGLSVKTKYGSFSNCVQTKDWNPLEPGEEEYKYFCPGIGFVYESEIDGSETVQLIDVISTKITKEIAVPVVELKRDITESEAKEIAKREVDGRVTDIEIEKKFGKAAYVVEIDDDGEEIDVIIDFMELKHFYLFPTYVFAKGILRRKIIYWGTCYMR